MQSRTALVSELVQERKTLAYTSNLHWFHWTVIILSALLTVASWYFSKTQIEQKTLSQFDRETSQVEDLVSERMQKYEDALWSGVAAIQASSGELSYAEWRTFAESLHIDTKYPGISGIGVVDYVLPEDLAAHIESQRRLRPEYRVHPEHTETEYLPIVYIEPEGPNAKAVGLDMAHETNRYNAAKNARDTGTAQITGPIVLVQDEGQTPGFLFYVPYYASDSADTVQDRQENFSGMVYAPFVVKKLMAGTLAKTKRRVGIRLSDGSNVIYNENTDAEIDFDPNPLFRTTKAMVLYGRTWNFDIWSTKSFRQASNSSQPTFILAGGIAIDALLITLFVMLSRSSRQALRFADRMTDELRRKAAALAKSNAELESFAYVASHDLKTPLRGIADLTTYLVEDLEPYISGPDGNPNVRHNLQRLHQQTNRMDNLINGILDYSSVGAREEIVETVDVAKVLYSLRSELHINDHQLILEGEIPVLNTYLLRFEQVMSNLLGNAFKYHHNREQATVTVSCRERGDVHEFSITDNGPGIDPKFHSRIFEVFQTTAIKR